MLSYEFRWIEPLNLLYGLRPTHSTMQMMYRLIGEHFSRCSRPARAPKEKVDSERPVAMDIT